MTTSDKQTILIVDSVPSSALVLANILKHQWSVDIAADGPSALIKAVANPLPDLILLNVQLSSMTGHEVCVRLQNNPRTKEIPIIFVTTKIDEKEEACGLELGAVDYLIKPICAPIAKARIRNHLAMSQSKAALAAKNRELERLASRDALTNLYNRWKMDDCFEKEIARAERFNHPLSVILIDIDRFKKINDTYSHTVGDSVLVEIAELLQSNIRSCDIPCRWGGEEFLIICPETELDTTAHLAERLRSTFSKKHFSVAGQQTASFGVATHHPGRTPTHIFRRADEAMYRAKQNGGNRVEKEEPKKAEVDG